jgi:hypothetical protein
MQRQTVSEIMPKNQKNGGGDLGEPITTSKTLEESDFMVGINKSIGVNEGEEEQMDNTVCSVFRSSVKQKLMSKRNWAKFKKSKESLELMNTSIKGWTNDSPMQNEEVLN